MHFVLVTKPLKCCCVHRKASWNQNRAQQLPGWDQQTYSGCALLWDRFQSENLNLPFYPMLFSTPEQTPKPVRYNFTSAWDDPFSWDLCAPTCLLQKQRLPPPAMGSKDHSYELLCHWVLRTEDSTVRGLIQIIWSHILHENPSSVALQSMSTLLQMPFLNHYLLQHHSISKNLPYLTSLHEAFSHSCSLIK